MVPPTITGRTSGVCDLETLPGAKDMTVNKSACGRDI